MGLPSRSFAADAHHCIMVQVRTGPTEYKGVARMSAPDGELPSDDLGHRKACGYVDDRLHRPSPLPRFPSKLESGEMLAFAHIPTGTTANEGNRYRWEH